MSLSRFLPSMALIAFAMACVTTGQVSAQAQATGPAIELERYEVAPGDQITVRVSGFLSNSVTVAVCGNRAIRGAGDCNMAESKGLAIDDGLREAAFTISTPPATCPCIIRVANASNDEVAVAPITLIGHPNGPLVGGGLGDPVEVSVVAQAVPDGAMDQLRSSLGGATLYELTVTVRNPSTIAVSGITVNGSAGKGSNDQLVTFDLVAPPELQPGQQFEEVVTAELPAPSWGTVEWRVAVSSSEPTVVTTTTTDNVAWLLWILGALLVLDLVILLIRFVVRLVRRNSDHPGDEGAENDIESVEDMVIIGHQTDELVGQR